MRFLNKQIMKKLALIALLLPFFTILSAQNLIGYKENEIRKYMSENMKDLSLNKVTNNKFIYLKYSDTSDSYTTLFFLGPDSVCKSIRIICDDEAKARKIKEFNTLYKRTGENHWVDRKNGKEYQIILVDNEWSSTITIN